MPELLAHLTRFLAEERGRILLDNALGEGIAAATLLKKGIDARRRASAMSSEELERRIGFLEKDLAGQSRTIEERRSGIREEVAAIRAWVKRDLDRFVEDTIRQVPEVVDSASGDEIKLHLGAFLEKTLTEWAQAETREIAGALETLAEKTIALVREDAHDVAKRLGDALGGDLKAPDVAVDTFGYDVGVVALATIGLGRDVHQRAPRRPAHAGRAGARRLRARQGRGRDARSAPRSSPPRRSATPPPRSAPSSTR